AGKRSKTIWVSRSANTFYDYRIGDVVAIGKIDEKYNTIDLLDVRGGKPTGYFNKDDMPKEETEGKKLEAVYEATNTMKIDGKLYEYAGSVADLKALVGKNVTFKTQEVNEKEYVFDIVEVEEDTEDPKDPEDPEDPVKPDPTVYTVKDLEGKVEQVLIGKYGITIQLDNVKEKFENVNEDTVLVLKVEGKEDIELVYGESEKVGKFFYNALISGYTVEELEAAVVTIK
ncbi:MAG: hypothetical protein GX982_06035, partial [Tissierellia bacterium]|nr:hypothetical protein [Tissierellia bacterium]